MAFIKTDLDFLAIPGIHPRLRELYGRLVLHAGKNGTCYPAHETLAKEIGLQSCRQIRRLVKHLRDLGLIEWIYGNGHPNTFRLVGSLPRTSVSGGVGHPCPRGGRTSVSYRKDKAAAKEVLKEKEGPSQSLRVKADQGGKNNTPAGAGKKTENLAAAETPKQAASALPPERAFRERLKERHGSSFDAARCIGNIQRALAKQGGFDFAEFEAYDREQTTCENLRSPNGYYVHLAKQFAKETRQQAAAALQSRIPYAEPPPEPPRDEKGRCSKCGGSGRLAENFCQCQLGRDLAALERRKPKSEKNSSEQRQGAA